MTDGLFSLDEVPEVPLLREPRRVRAARGVSQDARFLNDYPPEWSRCGTCGGYGSREPRASGESLLDRRHRSPCPDCLGMGSLKARVRLEAGHRCIRCKHPFVTKGDAKMLGVEPTPGHWSPCDEECEHKGTGRWREHPGDDWYVESPYSVASRRHDLGLGFDAVEAEWRVLTVHHLDGDKANLRWWNLAALCQRCHLAIQGKVVMERVYPHEHSEWFKPYVAGYYAFVYLCKVCGSDLTVAHPQGFPVPAWRRPHIPLARVESLGGADGFPHRCEPGFEVSRDEAVEHLDWLLDRERVESLA